MSHVYSGPIRPTSYEHQGSLDHGHQSSNHLGSIPDTFPCPAILPTGYRSPSSSFSAPPLRPKPIHPSSILAHNSQHIDSPGLEQRPDEGQQTHHPPSSSVTHTSPTPSQSPSKRPKLDSANPSSPSSTRDSIMTQSALLTQAYWEEERTSVYIAVVQGQVVPRRRDNDMINVTKLMNLLNCGRGKRDGALRRFKGMKSRDRIVVKKAPVNLKGIWVPLEAALDLATLEEISESLFPLFEPQETLEKILACQNAAQSLFKSPKKSETEAAEMGESSARMLPSAEKMKQVHQAEATPLPRNAPCPVHGASHLQSSSSMSEKLTHSLPPSHISLRLQNPFQHPFFGDVPRASRFRLHTQSQTQGIDHTFPNTDSAYESDFGRGTRRWSYSGVDSDRQVGGRGVTRGWGSLDADLGVGIAGRGHRTLEGCGWDVKQMDLGVYEAGVDVGRTDHSNRAQRPAYHHQRPNCGLRDFSNSNPSECYPPHHVHQQMTINSMTGAGVKPLYHSSPFNAPTFDGTITRGYIDDNVPNKFVDVEGSGKCCEVNVKMEECA